MKVLHEVGFANCVSVVSRKEQKLNASFHNKIRNKKKKITQPDVYLILVALFYFAFLKEWLISSIYVVKKNVVSFYVLKFLPTAARKMEIIFLADV